MHINFEFKAKCASPEELEKKLQEQNPIFIGNDHQIDTYFNVPYGRMKLREGTIENALIHYERQDIAGSKQSSILLYQHIPDAVLKQLLSRALGVKAVVDKRRRIYFIDNVKFHFDNVKELGTFVEVEAIDKDGSIGIEKLKNQCSYYSRLFEINADEYMADSYSDMLVKKSSNQ